LTKDVLDEFNTPTGAQEPMFAETPYIYIINETLSNLRIFYSVDELFELTLDQVVCGTTNIQWSELREDGEIQTFSQWEDTNASVLEMPQAPSSNEGLWNFDYVISKPQYVGNPELTKQYSVVHGEYVFQVDFQLP